MESKVDEKDVDLFALECELDDLRTLIEIIYNDFFSYSEEYTKQEYTLLIHEYARYSHLTSACLTVLNEAQKKCVALREQADNQESYTHPA